MCCFASLGMDTFGYCPSLQANTTETTTCAGNEYFGSFGGAMFTLFQVITPGSNWATDIARPLMHDFGDFGVAAYFVLFIFIFVFLCVPILGAVLLDKLGAHAHEQAGRDEVVCEEQGMGGAPDVEQVTTTTTTTMELDRSWKMTGVMPHARRMRKCWPAAEKRRLPSVKWWPCEEFVSSIRKAMKREKGRHRRSVRLSRHCACVVWPRGSARSPRSYGTSSRSLLTSDL